VQKKRLGANNFSKDALLQLRDEAQSLVQFSEGLFELEGTLLDVFLKGGKALVQVLLEPELVMKRVLRLFKLKLSLVKALLNEISLRVYLLSSLQVQSDVFKQESRLLLQVLDESFGVCLPNFTFQVEARAF